MFRLIRMLFFIAIGFYLGLKFNEMQMRSQCASGAGNWTGAICLNSELK